MITFAALSLLLLLTIQKQQDSSIKIYAVGPTTPPAQVCGNTGLLKGSATAPAGAVTVPAGNNSAFTPATNTTYWFAPGTHTLGTDQYSQIVPADGDTFIGGPGAVLDGQNKNLYAFTQHARRVTIEYLTIQNFGPAGANQDEGVVNHDAGHNWTITHNTVQNDAGAGVFIGTGDTVSYNCLKNNGQYGFSAYESNGVSNITLDHNEITGNNTYDWEKKISGCGCTGDGKFWATNHATITNNWSHNNHGPGFWADTNNNDFDIENNYISNNDGIGIEYEISYNALIKNNTLVRNALVSGPEDAGFPDGAVYLSESGGDSRVAARYSKVQVTGNQFIDNWGGVVLWENADRFCNSPPNTSGGACTLVNPTQVNLNTCISEKIKKKPYYSDCRWKTKNVSVDHNEFDFNPTNIGSKCTTANICGFQGIFSNYGTYPSWSPYQGTVIEDAITFHQSNVFAANTYTGPWHFMPHDQGTSMDFATWQATPYNQDAGSTSPGANPPTPQATPTQQPTPTPQATPGGGSTSPVNVLDADTATIESSTGKWVDWYSETASRSTKQAHGGHASLKVSVTAVNGWGVQVNNWPGFPVGLGVRTVSFWALAGSSREAGKIASTVSPLPTMIEDFRESLQIYHIMV